MKLSNLGAAALAALLPLCAPGLAPAQPTSAQVASPNSSASPALRPDQADTLLKMLAEAPSHGFRADEFSIDDLPLDKAVLVGCGVPTGWGAAVNTANVRAGDTVLVVGIGGIGINAVQGARYAGAKNVIAIDPLENKREKAMELGATHAFASTDEAMAAITDMTRGQMADSAILTPGIMTSEIVAGGFHAIGKGGTVVLTGLNKVMEQTIELPGTVMTLYRKTVKGSLFGDCNPTTDIPKILGLYQSGDIKLDEIITRTYTLDQVQEGYDDLLAGKNIRGIVVHEHSS